MRVMITGGAGFIGSALTRMALGRGIACTIIDKLTYAGHRSSLAAVADAPGFSFVEADICDADAMRIVFTQHEPDAVFHLAAESHVDRSIAGAGDFVRTNVTGTFVMLEAARAYHETLSQARRDAFRFIHVSSDEVFGALGGDGVFNEATPYDPRSPYSATKAGADHLVRAWRHTYGLPCVIGNCSNNFGPRQLPEKLIPLLILSAVEGKLLPLYGDGLQVRDWLYVDDHARALLLLLEAAPGETYAIGARQERTNLAVAESVCDLVDEMAPASATRRELIRFVADRPGHDRRYAIDPAKIERDLGWRAETTFEDGLRRTIRWYLDNQAWCSPLLTQSFDWRPRP